MKHVLLLISLICFLPNLVWGQAQTHTAVPAQNATFITDLQTFLRGEDAARYVEQFSGFVVSGGVDTTGGTITHSPTAITAYPGA